MLISQCILNHYCPVREIWFTDLKHTTCTINTVNYINVILKMWNLKMFMLIKLVLIMIMVMMIMACDQNLKETGSCSNTLVLLPVYTALVSCVF